MRSWTPGIRVSQSCVSWRLYPSLSKHSKRFSLEDALSIGVDRMQRNFDPMRQQVERWRVQQLSGEMARLTIYRAFIESALEVPKHLARRGVRSVFQSAARGIRTAYDVEPLKRIYFSLQGTGSDSAI
jgi:hypothetical protein